MKPSSSSSIAGLDPLKDLLSDVLHRLEILEQAVGTNSSPLRGGGSGGGISNKSTSTLPSSSGHHQPQKKSFTTGGEVPALKAYDAFVKECVVPFALCCDNIGFTSISKSTTNTTTNTIGTDLQNGFEGIRQIILIASRSKAPKVGTTDCDYPDLNTAFGSQLLLTQNAVQKIRSYQWIRDYDQHYKALCEMVTCLSWIFYSPPKQQLPASFVKETISSAEFWTNRIKKDSKNKINEQIQYEFCDKMKYCLVGLEKYITEYHKTGLTFNPRGVSLAEAIILLSDEETTKDGDVTGTITTSSSSTDHHPDGENSVMKSPKTKRHPTLLGTSAGGGVNITGIMGELSKRKNAEGSSAATGLKHVSKDQQTWRKEYKKEEQGGGGGGTAVNGGGPMPTVPTLTEKKETQKKKVLKGIPIFEYQDRGFKWVIENQTKESVIRETSTTGVITVEISDPKQQVYMYNCDNVTVQINGKFKSLVLDKCNKCSVVYDTLISSAEVVNCTKIQLQVTGICPVFTIDKTVNVLIWLSEQSKSISTFTTSLSSELNVSYPDGEDQKELPIPEQFVHKLNTIKGTLSSDVSDLYH